jgi:hypothetical protein
MQFDFGMFFPVERESCQRNRSSRNLLWPSLSHSYSETLDRTELRFSRPEKSSRQLRRHILSVMSMEATPRVGCLLATGAIRNIYLYDDPGANAKLSYAVR